MANKDVVRFAQGISDRIAQNISGDIRAKLRPQMDEITNMLKLASVQRLATDEHAVIRKKKTFRQLVLSRLNRISKQLPEEHPVRRQIDLLYKLEVD
jgi:hypothetical protein